MNTLPFFRRSLLALACLAPVALGAEGPQVFAITGAKIVRVSAASIDSGTVVIRGGLIEAVGANITAPADAWVIDGKGLTVYPGLVDALSTWGLPGATPLAAGAAAGGGRRGAPAAAPSIGATATPAPAINGPEDRPSNSAYLKAADMLSLTDRSIETARDGGFTTAITYPTTNIFAGQGSAIDLAAGDRAGDMVILPSAGLYLKMSSGAGGGGGGGSYPGSLMGAIAYIRQIYLDAEHYKLANSIYAKQPQGLARPAYDRYLEAVLQSPRTLLPAGRTVEFDRMIHLAQELKIPAVLYGAQEGYRDPEMIAKSKFPVLVSLKWPVHDPQGNPADVDTLRMLEVREKAPSTPAAFVKAGVKFAFYSDGITAPRDLMRGVKRAIDNGLAPADAIRALTLSAAEIYGIADRTGSIDKGKIGNLVISEGDLFADRPKIKYVFVDGMKYEPAAEAPAARRGAETTNE